ncbi:hypothetical protein E2562_004365 [Oryza meyeriana var. granulata]|uniref:Uncharacterized protein n=1 Tax=Oryza meyeriana var. granulata TaxID=110450 RepID=A0A6G1CZ72_9ORYZ|nr:hypothetical protein E2562_004365 [Oryza meyeriana var. granulata]
MLTSRVNILLNYYRETNPAVETTLCDAIEFFKDKKQWDYWPELLIHATTVGSGEITCENIDSIFWAESEESEIHKEKTNDREKEDKLKDSILKCWLEKQNRGYKWFSNVPLPDFKDHRNTWFSDADANGDTMSLAPQNWDPAEIDPHPKELKVQTNDRRLVITDDKVLGSKPALYYAWMTGKLLRSAMVPCVVMLKKPMHEVDRIFSLLMRLQHPNILKPLGVWPCKDDPNSGYIIFPRVDGAISTIPRLDLFVEDNNVIGGFTENGYKILSCNPNAPTAAQLILIRAAGTPAVVAVCVMEPPINSDGVLTVWSTAWDSD